MFIGKVIEKSDDMQGIFVILTERYKLIITRYSVTTTWPNKRSMKILENTVGDGGIVEYKHFIFQGLHSEKMLEHLRFPKFARIPCTRKCQKTRRKHGLRTLEYNLFFVR